MSRDSATFLSQYGPLLAAGVAASAVLGGTYLSGTLQRNILEEQARISRLYEGYDTYSAAMISLNYARREMMEDLDREQSFEDQPVYQRWKEAQLAVLTASTSMRIRSAPEKILNVAEKLEAASSSTEFASGDKDRIKAASQEALSLHQELLELMRQNVASGGP